MESLNPEMLLASLLSARIGTMPVLTPPCRKFIASTITCSLIPSHLYKFNYEERFDQTTKELFESDMMEAAKRCSPSELTAGVDVLFNYFSQDDPEKIFHGRGAALEDLLPVIQKADPKYAWYAADKIHTYNSGRPDAQQRIALYAWSLYPLLKNKIDPGDVDGFTDITHDIILTASLRIKSGTPVLQDVAKEALSLAGIHIAQGNDSLSQELLDAALRIFPEGSAEKKQAQRKMAEIRANPKSAYLFHEILEMS
jgi:hypothetical protein